MTENPLGWSLWVLMCSQMHSTRLNELVVISWSLYCQWPLRCPSAPCYSRVSSHMTLYRSTYKLWSLTKRLLCVWHFFGFSWIDALKILNGFMFIPGNEEIVERRKYLVTPHCSHCNQPTDSNSLRIIDVQWSIALKVLSLGSTQSIPSTSEFDEECFTSWTQRTQPVSVNASPHSYFYYDSNQFYWNWWLWGNK